MAHNVLVVGELADGAPAPTTLELLGGANQLADGGDVSVVFLGTGAKDAAGQATGASKAYVNDNAEFDQFRSEQWLNAIAEALDQSGADVVLMAQSIVGREVAPRLAHRRDTAAAMDCVNLVDEGGSVKVTRPAYGGNAHATYSFTSMPAIATVRAKSFDPIESGSAPSDVVEVSGPGESRTTITGREEVVAEGLQLQDAKIVVSGGRGLGAPEAFEMIEDLAAAIGTDRAAVGASRAAVDLGWYPPAQQIGLTGKVVTPELYIAIAISGASQHMAGCSGSKTIVAINRDKDANIFSYAKYGIVGDYKQVVPALIEALKS